MRLAGATGASLVEAIITSLPRNAHRPVAFLCLLRKLAGRVGAAVPVLAVALVAGCTTMETSFPLLRSLGVYKLDINQGNYLSQDVVDKLKVGQTKQQVRFLLGTPLLVSAFRPDRWDYVYEFSRQGYMIEHRTFTVYFVDDKVARWEGDEMPASVAELNRRAAARTAGEQGWADQRSFLEKLFDVFRN
jgi:outer membrane protein assembly factor BamE